MQKFPNPSSSNYKVLATDYDTYTIVYSCDQRYGMYFSEYAWIMTRDPTPSDAIVDEMRLQLEGYGYDTSTMRRTFQGEGCEYLYVE